MYKGREVSTLLSLKYFLTAQNLELFVKKIKTFFNGAF